MTLSPSGSLRVWRLIGRKMAFEISTSHVVGRGRGCDFPLSSVGVSRRHAQLELKHGQPVIRDLGSSNGTFVNRSRIREQVLEVGDEVRFATESFRVEGPSHPIDAVPRTAVVATSATSSAEQSSARFEIVAGAMPGSFLLSGTRYVVGRGPDSDIVLPMGSVSVRHAQLERTVALWRLTDLGSNTGTFVNGVRIESLELRPGDLVRIGEVELRFVIEAPGQLPGFAPVPAGGPPAGSMPDGVVPPWRPPASTEKGLGQRQTPPSVAAEMDGARAQLEREHVQTEDYRRGLAWLIFSSQGRINRKVWWLTFVSANLVKWALYPLVVFLFGFSMAGLIAQALVDFSGTIQGIFVLAVALFVLFVLDLRTDVAIISKRLHDTGRSAAGWMTYYVFLWFLLPVSAFVPLLAPIGLVASLPFIYLMIVCGFMRGEDGPNVYGG